MKRSAFFTTLFAAPLALLGLGNRRVPLRGKLEADKWVDRPRVVNVKDLGAKGDGETDDSEAFQLAFARAGEIGAVVGVPYGKYILGSQIVVTGHFFGCQSIRP